MRYYVIYRYYSEYNQFEGSWDTYHNEFDDEQKARDYIKTLGKDEFIAGPLIELK